MNDKNQNLSEKPSVYNQNILEKAFSFYSRKDFEKAEYFFALALEEHENAKNYFFRGKCFMNLKQPLAAIACFEKARNFAPKSFCIYTKGIITLLQLKFPDKALEWIDKAQELKIKTTQLIALKGCALLQKKAYRQAANCFSSAIKNGINTADIFSKLAICFFFMHDYKNARIFFYFAHQTITGNNNFKITLLYYEALSLKKDGQYQKALAILNKIPTIYKSSKFAEILYLQGICYYRLKKINKALFYINASIGENPQISNSYKTKAAILKHMNMQKQSINCTEKATQIENENKRKKIQMQQIIEKEANNLKNRIEYYEQQTAVYNKKLKENPFDAGLYAEKAAILLDLQQYHETISCCNNALKLNPKEKNAIKEKSRALFALGRYEEALNCITSID